VVKFHTDLISLACLALTTVFSYTNRVLVHFPEKMTDGVTEQKKTPQNGLQGSIVHSATISRSQK
jgi:hypothetical protein